MLFRSPEYCRQNGLFFLKAGLIMALIGALDALVSLSGALYVLLYLLSLIHIFVLDTGGRIEYNTMDIMAEQAHGALAPVADNAGKNGCGQIPPRCKRGFL